VEAICRKAEGLDQASEGKRIATQYDTARSGGSTQKAVSLPRETRRLSQETPRSSDQRLQIFGVHLYGIMLVYQFEVSFSRSAHGFAYLT
jgi:hypothetical protein